MAKLNASKLNQKVTELKELVSRFPGDPGVYLMKNVAEKIIYVGKAKSLKNRVRSYFNNTEQSVKTYHLVSHIDRIEYIVTRTEVEALLLEASLIKKHRPKYNILLKDDKSYPYIRVSMTDKFPRLYLARKVKRDGSQYFGPFTSGLQVWETIRFLNRTFRIRDCADHFMKNRTRPCLTHQIGHCTAPCVALVDESQYREELEGAILFLRGRDKQLVKQIEKRMKVAADQEQFEYAAKLRDSINSLKSILQKQSVIDSMREKDQDAIGFDGDDRGCTIEVLHVRQGKVLGSQPHFVPLLNPQSPDESVQDWLVSFINQYYAENVIPDEVLVPVDLGKDLNKLLGQVLFERSGREVLVRFPTSKDGAQLIEMAHANATNHFKTYVSKSEKKNQGLEEIKAKLNLPSLPIRIECYDISNFQGDEAVASQVVFEGGVPLKDDYRRYKIKSVQGQNDFAMMKEVLSRRFKHEELDDPHLLVVDGGRGQLSVAIEVLAEMGKTIPVCGLAKARTQGRFSDKDVKGTEERVFLPERQNPVVFAKNSEALHILTGIRDEAHRFAITYHRHLRENKSLESELDYVVGLGEKRKKALLKKFESIDQIRTATAEAIAEVPGFNRVLAERILLQLSETDEQAQNLE
ncbi:MAG: excinuclease ABC subunit UvrC [Oligoflexia bacterium]|nr:excinuclease ABC subunit UvrC [Oligoflexia bacterium]